MREASELQIVALENASHLQSVKLEQHLTVLGEELTHKKVLIEQLVTELKQKNDAIETFRTTLDEERVLTAKQAKEIANLKKIAEQSAENDELYRNDNKLYAQFKIAQKRATDYTYIEGLYKEITRNTTHVTARYLLTEETKSEGFYFILVMFCPGNQVTLIE